MALPRVVGRVMLLRRCFGCRVRSTRCCFASVTLCLLSSCTTFSVLKSWHSSGLIIALRPRAAAWGVNCMATMIRSVLQSRITIGLSAIQDTILPPNPISHLVLTARFQTLAGNTLPTWANLMAGLTSIDVLHRGTAVFSMRPADLWAYNVALGLHSAIPFRNTTPVNSTGFATWIIPFGRSLYNPDECFPATRAGELICRLTRAASDTNTTAPTWTLTSVELPDAQPSRFARATTLTFTPSATGDNDFQLYPSTVYCGMLAFSTTVPTGTAFTTTLDRVQLLLNNLQYDIAQANFEDLWAEWVNRGGQSGAMLEHIHLENTAAMYTQNVDTGAPRIVGHPLANYVWLDFDPTRDLMYAIDARNIARVALRVNAGDTAAIRVMPQEMIYLAG